jgi:REP element-mobilizing transposase RayT
MPNTFTQLYIQLVFVVKYREALIAKAWKDELYKYITGIVQHSKSKMLAINGMPDHLHIFIGYVPSIPLPDLVKNIKVASTLWINTHKLTGHRFNWQEGYGAFSYRRSDLPQICRYIENQETHHQKVSFKKEFKDQLHEFDVPYEDKWLFDSFDDLYPNADP